LSPPAIAVHDNGDMPGKIPPLFDFFYSRILHHESPFRSFLKIKLPFILYNVKLSCLEIFEVAFQEETL